MTYPSVAPTVVPTAPMTRPCSMKIAVTLRAPAPIVLRMPMSRCFSMTSSISDATMFSAATITMSPMASDTANFSSVSAEKSALFICPQSCAVYLSPSRVPTSCAMAGAA